MRQLELGAVTAHLPLALAVVLDPDGVFVEFEYQTDVLGAALVDQMLAHYIALLDNALTTPERRVTSLDMLGSGERESVLQQSHGDLVPMPATTMVAILESAAAARPDAVALVSDEARADVCRAASARESPGALADRARLRRPTTSSACA